MSRFASYPSLRGRAILVTGGASGIGSSIVTHLIDQGAKVGFIDTATRAAEALLDSLSGMSACCRFVEADLRDIAALRRAVGLIAAEIGDPVGLVNNAASDDRHALDEVTPAYWDDRMATNLRHQFFTAQAVKAGMIAAGFGSIVNFSSDCFAAKVPGMPVYLTAKAGVIGLTRALARELGSHHIRVNTLVPGWIMTQRQQELWLTPGAEQALMRDQCIPELLYPDDVARLVLWLLADDSRHVTAQQFTVDGGRT
jgi:NAD(P)-dependent dehydrogenase (short-subunit alcohol dehydrogenase family)